MDPDVCVECEWHSHLAERTAGEVRERHMGAWWLHRRAEHQTVGG